MLSFSMQESACVISVLKPLQATTVFCYVGGIAVPSAQTFRHLTGYPTGIKTCTRVPVWKLFCGCKYCYTVTCCIGLTFVMISLLHCEMSIFIVGYYVLTKKRVMADLKLISKFIKI